MQAGPESGSAAPAEAGRAAWRLDLALLAVSACVLTLQVLQTKVFAYSLDPLTIYLAIGVCMLGLGASATLLASLPTPAPARVPGLVAAAAIAGAVAIVPTHAVFAAFAPGLGRDAGASVLVLLCLTLPYLCFGLAIALALVARSRQIGRAYAANLAGSGLGCLAVFPLFDALGAERALVAVAWLALAAALLVGRRTTLGAAAAAALLLVGAFARAPDWLEFPPERNGQLAVVLARAARLEAENPGETVRAEPVFSRWDRTARIDVYDLTTSIEALHGRPVESLFFVQDSSAGSILLGVGNELSAARPFFERTIYGAGYARADKPRDVLVIGLGGGPDVLTALHHGARRIVGVEINRTTIELVREEFADYLGRPYARPEVEIRQLDGRSFVRASRDLFDLIQLSGVDTKSVFAAGSLSLNENYLYTREALGEILVRLKPDGVLVLNRFRDVDLHRLATTALAALRDLGADRPERHLLAIGQGLWRGLLVRRTPFPAHELDALAAWVAEASDPPDVVIPPFDWIGVSLRRPMQLLYSPEPRPLADTPYFEALRSGRVEAFVEAERALDLRPPVDDRPFFFFYARPGEALRAAFGQKTKALLTAVAELLRNLHRVLLLLTAIACVFIFAPLLARRRRGLRAPGAAAALGYFACLGAGFMLIEIGLIQRFVLLLGHQAYAVSVVIFGLLTGASLGSLLSGRLPAGQAGWLRAVLAAVIGIVVLYGTALDPLFEAAAVLSFAARLLLALALLVAAGALLGVPFPAAMRALESSSVPFVAWGVGVNGFASVLAATAAVEVSLLVGLRWLLIGAAALYALAAALAPVGPGRRAAP